MSDQRETTASQQIESNDQSAPRGAILRSQGLVKRFDGRPVVNGVDLEIHGGEIVGLLGPNGAGKTTTFLMTVGLIVADEGRVNLNGQDITDLPLHRRAGRGIGYLPQEASVFRNLTVRENFLAILELTEPNRTRQLSRCEHLLRDFNLKHVEHTKGFSLSGGERRRVEIARALIPNPDFLLLDEPFAGVDPIAVEEVQELVVMLKNRGIGVLITDHNVRETLAITDRSYIMNKGRILVSGDPEKLVNHEEARTVYLGKSFSYDGIKRENNNA